jgi:hypothetical protein
MFINSRVWIEPRTYDGVVPDAVLSTQARDGSARMLLIEVAVRHAVDSEKLRRLRELALPVIELTLKPQHAQLQRSELEARILNSATGKRWLFHPRQIEWERRFEDLYRSERERVELEQAERAKAENERIERMRRALSSNASSAMENPMAAFFARHGRYPSQSEISEVLKEAIAKRQSK